MGWSDIFFPGNPERRERLISKNQELKNLMENNFRATNKLIKVLNEHLGNSFSEITLNEKADVKTNCDVLIECIREIQAAVEKIDQKLKDKLEPTLYEKLKNMDLSLSTVEHAEIGSVILGVGGLAAIVAVSYLICSGKILANLVLKCSMLGASAVAGAVLGVVFLGIDMIVEAIEGSIERDQLEHALKEYDTALEEFKPASEEYQDKIFEVIAEMKMKK